jgi:FkbM family methyltransferase
VKFLAGEDRIKRFVEGSYPDGSVRNRLAQFARDWSGAGPNVAMRLALSNVLRNLPSWIPGQGRTVALRIKNCPHPFRIRLGSSDGFVVRQIFVEREYEGIAEVLDGDPFILDLGANIGCSAFWFLSQRPDATILCVEPGPSNVALCRRNLAPFGSSVSVLQAAIWTDRVPLHIVRPPQREEWALQVEPVQNSDDTIDLMGVPVDDLIEDRSAVDLVKMDIEGAEIGVLSAGTWLSRTRNLAIELHNPRAEEALRVALANFGYTNLSRQGELTIAWNLHTPPDGTSSGRPIEQGA